MPSSVFLSANSAMKLHDIYLELPSEQIAYVKFIFESYEDVGIIRTVDRKKAIIVLLVMDASSRTRTPSWPPSIKKYRFGKSPAPRASATTG